MTRSLVILLIVIAGLASAFPSKSELTKPSRLRSRNGIRGSKVGIYDGTSTTIEDHPYLVGILLGDYFLCAGVILSKQWIITDADCTVGSTKTDFTIVSGSSDGSTGTSHKVKKIVTHPNYSYSGDLYYYYDFALIQIKGSFTWGDSTANISLPSSELKAKTETVVSGYGDTDDANEGTILEGKMKWLANETCSEWFKDYLSWSESQACVYNKGKVTLCEGDFGDPFVVDDVLYGIALGGLSSNSCTSEAWPFIVGDIYSVVDWIQKYTGAQVA